MGLVEREKWAWKVQIGIFRLISGGGVCLLIYMSWAAFRSCSGWQIDSRLPLYVPVEYASFVQIRVTMLHCRPTLYPAADNENDAFFCCK